MAGLKKVNAWVFSETAEEKPKLKGKSEEDFLINLYSNKFNFGFMNLKETGIYRLMGWAFDFKPFLKKYVYKTRAYGLEEGYFLNKSDLRRLTGSRVLYIKEIEQ